MPFKLRLDALMGPQRDVEKKKKRNPAEDWKDESVCRSLLTEHRSNAKLAGQ